MERFRRSFEETPIVDRDGYAYLVHPISNCVPTLDPGLLRAVAVETVRVADLDGVDKIVTPAAMGIHISTAVSLLTDIPLVVVRKREYGLEGEVSATQRTGYSAGEMFINDVRPDDRVLVLDGLVSTGGTMGAIVEALDDVGAEIADVVIAIHKVDGGDALGVIPSPVKTLVDVRLDDGGVVVVDGSTGDGSGRSGDTGTGGPSN